MEATSMRRADADPAATSGIDWPALGTWVLCFGLIVFLGLEGGGFDPLVHDQVGIAAWWLVLATVLAGALPRRRLSRPALAALILLAAFALWAALSLIWTESAERTFVDIARLTTYVAIFALALATRDSRETQWLVGAVASAIAFLAGVALLSRFHPSWFSGAEQTGRLLASEERLSYPLDYWNALAALMAIGAPLLLQLASGARHTIARGLAGAALPLLPLTLYFTISRGGIVATALAVAIFLALASDRLAKLPALFVTGAAGALLIVLASHRTALHHGLATPLAHDQGSEMTWICIGVCLVSGLLVAGLALLGRGVERPAWTRPSVQASATALAVCVLGLLVVGIAVGAPGRVSDAWSEFKAKGGPGEGTGRLGSVAGESRYQFWSSAVEENSTAPLIGTGSGTFQFWWAREGDGTETVRDTHSLYLQTLGEVGIVGLLLLLGFIGVVLVAGVRNAMLTDAAERSRLAAALAGFSAFFLAAAVDWMWQVPVLPVAALLLAGAAAQGRDDGVKPRLGLAARGSAAAIALIAIVAIAIPLASTDLVRESQAQARAGDLEAALGSARSAQNVESYAAGPRLQQALVLELEGRFGEAEAAARAATERESTNWRNWLVLSRTAAENGRAKAAVAAFEKARSLNPHGDIFRTRAG